MGKIDNKIQEIFKQFPKTEKLFATSDAQVFINENRAKLHAQSLKDETVSTFHKELKEEKSEGSEKKKTITVKELELFAKDSSDIPALEKMLEEEKNSSNRASAIKALEIRIKTLKEQS